MAEIFRMTGFVVTPKGERCSNLRLAVIDKDLLFDDLLALGFTDDCGAFRLSFTRDEFNQDFGESEALPDVKIVFSNRFDDGHFRAVLEVDFPGLLFTSGVEELGEIVLTTWDGETAPALEGVEATPGWGKRVKRLDIDDDLVAHCLTEVTPMVESLTGWSGLLDDLKVDVTDKIAPYVTGALFETFGLSRSSLQGRAINAIFERLFHFLAIYDPFTHTIVVHRDKAARNNLDGLKVVLGHELVHVGQFKYHPELLEAQRQSIETIFEEASKGLEGGLDPARFKISPLNERMRELEGYAYYIQRDFLEKHYNLATFFTHRSFLETLVQYAARSFMPEASHMQEVKSDQYTDGIEIFRKKSVDSDPATFR